MPWSPGGSDAELLDQLGWTPDGPDTPTPDPVTGWWRELAGTASSDLGRGLDRASARALGVAKDLGRGLDKASIRALGSAKDLGQGLDKASVRAICSAADLGRGLDVASGKLAGTAFTDLGRGLDRSAARAIGAAKDLGVGQDRCPVTKVSGTARDLGHGADTASGRWLDAWTGSRSAFTIDQNDWEHILTFTPAGNTTGTCNFSVSHSWGSNGLQWWPIYRRLRITINDTQVGSYAQQQHQTNNWSTTSTWTGVSVPATATVRIEGWSECAYSGPRTVTISAASMTVTSI